MNINQYMCNMKVLVGLFLANSIGFKVDLYHRYNSLAGRDVVETIDINDETNQLMYFNYIIYPGHTNINTYIIYSIKLEEEYIYSQFIGDSIKLDVFLL